ncbi:MAG TPA: family 20 glycosylhydrolase, partial [Terriglobales bacterium]|nr:family 20 glycosylhydrolase [Terriglobales bacterium]
MKALLTLLLFSAMAWAQPQWNLMPMPASVAGGEGELVIGGGFTVAVHGDARLQRAATRFLAQLARQTGIPISNQLQKGDTATLVVSAEHDAKDVQQLGEDESYSLTVTSQSARISAPTTLGAMYGLQTFLQLVQTSPRGFVAPAVTIQDRPRFPWRGLLLDVCRHWMPVEVVKRTLDGMAVAKLNVLHWHLSEDQAVRVESKKLRKLQEVASAGHFYTQAEIKEIIAYARDRGIRVVPEFDMPGHTTAWLAAYPELASGPGPYGLEHGFDTRGVMDPTRDSTYKFLKKFIGEMSKLFPDAFWHSGGDEVNFKEWDGNPKIQEFKRAHNLADDEALQAYFTGRLVDILKKHGKRMVGWDEVFDPELAKTMVVQSWRGPKSLAETARAGYDSILSNGYYLDLAHHAADYYAVDPLGGDAASLSPAEQAHILGGEACMWAEIVSPETVDSRIWPSAAAVAEKLWSPASVNDVESMYRRLDRFSGELEFLGVTADANYWPMLRRLAGDGDPAALRTLADVVEPIKDYQRHNSRPYTINTPLNRLPDAARTESQTARNFALMV